MGKRPLRVTGFGLVIGSMLGLIYAVHLHFMGEDGKPVSWAWAFADHGAFWLAWGFLSGPIAWLVYRFPVGRRRRNLFYHLGASVMISPVHSLACFFAISLVLPH